MQSFYMAIYCNSFVKGVLPTNILHCTRWQNFELNETERSLLQRVIANHI